MNIDKELESLTRIKRVEPPAFLLTRIMERVKTNPQAPLAWRLAFAGASIIIVCINVSILLSASISKDNKGVEGIVNTMELSTTNDLYHE
jgi:uncharacterized lipoprotein YbaY